MCTVMFFLLVLGGYKTAWWIIVLAVVVDFIQIMWTHFRVKRSAERAVAVLTQLAAQQMRAKREKEVRQKQLEDAHVQFPVNRPGGGKRGN